MDTYVIFGKEIKVKESTAEKIDKTLRFVGEKLCPAMAIAGTAFVIGHVIGQEVGYKAGFRVGTVSGATLAFEHVLETAKDLKQ